MQDIMENAVVFLSDPYWTKSQDISAFAASILTILLYYKCQKIPNFMDVWYWMTGVPHNRT